MVPVRLYDRLGRFVGRFAVEDLARVARERCSNGGYAISDDAIFWEPVAVTLDRLQCARRTVSGVRMVDRRALLASIEEGDQVA